MQGCELQWQGDSQLLLIFSKELNLQANKKLIAFDEWLEAHPVDGVIERIPSYSVLAISVDVQSFCRTSLEGAYGAFLTWWEANEKGQLSDGKGQGRIVRIPVCYGGEYGEDLGAVAKHTGLSEGEVIERHAAPQYRVYMLGFMPGFPYLGGMDEGLKTPRLEVPRLKIPAGSVGIADGQTGIYPLQSPGGWQIIGRTPLPLFNALSDDPTLLKAGDTLIFVPISERQYQALAQNGGSTWVY